MHDRLVSRRIDALYQCFLVMFLQYHDVSHVEFLMGDNTRNVDIGTNQLRAETIQSKGFKDETNRYHLDNNSKVCKSLHS